MLNQKNVRQVDFQFFDKYLYLADDSPSGLRWKLSIFGGKDGNVSIATKDSIAGSLDPSTNYYRVMIDGYNYGAHRVVFQIANNLKCISKHQQIDHIDKNRSNNKLCNLRLVSNALNSKNKNMQSNNNSGVTGVSFNTVNNREYWTASWSEVNGKRKSKSFNVDKLGHDKAKEMAIEHRNAQLKRLNEEGAGYTDSHGN